MHGSVGKSVLRTDARRFVTGRVPYSADMIEPGTLHVAVVRSIHAHAFIRSVDVRAALKAAGVVHVLDGATAKALTQPSTIRIDPRRLPGAVEVRCLADREILYAGEPVCAVVATNIHDAEAAAELVTVDYEVLEPVLDAEVAVKDSHHTSRSDWPTNVALRDVVSRGDAERALATADCVVRGRISFRPATSAPIEPRCYVASWDASGERLTLRGTIQMPHPTRWAVAHALRLKDSQVRVVAPHMGGTFGLKMTGHPEEVLVSLLSKILGRPVAFIETRAECLLATGREQTHEFELAADSKGKLLAFRDRMVADVGTISAGVGYLMALVTPTVFPTVYDIPSCQVESVIVTTNKPPWHGIRGFGKEVANLVVEHAIDLVARKLGLDPVAVRRQNVLARQSLPQRLPSGLNIDSGDYPGALTQVEELFDYKRWKEARAQARDTERPIGLGIAFELTPEGASFPGNPPSGVETSSVKVEPSGEIIVATSVTSPGSGNETGIAQLVADVFGIDPDTVVVLQGDTDNSPLGTGNNSSRSVMFGGMAAVLAAREVRTKLQACAAEMLGASETELEFSNNEIRVTGAAERSLPFASVARAVYSQAYTLARNVELPLVSIKSHRAENLSHVPDQTGRITAYPSFSYSVHAAAVEVDREVGQVRILDYAGIHDCGTVVNPALVEGQFRGAIAMGIGAALWEEIVLSDAGKLQTDRFKTYLLPRADELPPIRIEHRTTPSPFHPLGLKGAGESGVGGAMAAVINAVADATGSPVSRIPFRAVDVLESIGRGAR